MAPSKYSVDPIVEVLCQRNAILSHRSLLVLRGETIDHQAAILAHFVYKASSHSSVLWCHRKDAELPKSSRKTLKSFSNKIKSGQLDVSALQPLDLLMHSSAVRFCNYYDSLSALGNTYGMCVLQDVECLTPNLLCRLVETVSGGGAVVLLLPGISHLRQLCGLDMDAHYRFTTFSHPTPCKLFNNRLALSLAWCRSSIILDEKLHVCHDVANMKYNTIQPPSAKELSKLAEVNQELLTLQGEMADAAKPLPQLLQLCKTKDQGTALLTLVDVVTERTAGAVVSITAGRGRGKSAVLGLAVAAAVDLGLSNIFVTSPTPHNLTAFFQLLFAGFDALEYEEGKDYEITQSTNPDFSGAIVRVTVFKEYRQNIQYVLPSDHAAVRQAELVVVDEAAAIPLPQLQELLRGQHFTLMSSTVAGYEGTGRSLSLKLLKELRRQSTRVEQAGEQANEVRELHEVTLSRSIRYGDGDPVEEWLYKLLCLNATEMVPPVTSYPAPQACTLYYVDKCVLLSGNKGSEQFLHRVQSLLVSSHYRNSPDDLHALADAPAHHLFVLLPPLPQAADLSTLPAVLCVLQVCLEGGISSSRCSESLRRGDRPPGDLLPWTLAAQFQRPDLASLTGARVVRVATHPDCQSMGYGSRAINELHRYYSGCFVNLADVQQTSPDQPEKEESGPVAPLHGSEHLLLKLSTRVPEPVDYVSTAYGITPQLYKFWAKANFSMVYISQVVNKTTGEHSCMMVRPSFNGDEEEDTSVPPAWLVGPCQEFVRRLLMLLGGPLRSLPPALAHDLIRSHHSLTKPEKSLTWKEVECHISGHDLRRLEKYSKNIVDRHLVTDIVPAVAMLFAQQKLIDLQLSNLQAALLVGAGLQNKELMVVGEALGLSPQSTLGNFNRAMTRAYRALAAVQEAAFASKLASVVPDLLAPVDITVDQDLNRLAKETQEERPDLAFSKRQRDSDGFGHAKKQKKNKKGKYIYPL